MTTPSLTAEVERLWRETWDDFYLKQEILLIHGKDDPRLDVEFWARYTQCGASLSSEDWSGDV